MRILVTGGQGFLGRRLVPLLQAEGHEVVAPRRGSDGFPADLALVGDWGGWPARLDAVIHLAALNPVRGERAAQDDAALMRANVAATKALAVEAIRRGARRFVFASTLLVHPFGPEPFQEDDATAPQNAYAASKLAAEEALVRTLEDTPTRWCILRLAPIYGAGGRGGLHALLRLAESRLPLPFGGGGKRSLLSVRNAADAFVFALASERAANETFLVADDRPLAVGEIVAIFRRLQGRPARLVTLPRGLTARAARLAGRGAGYERLFGQLEADTSKLRQAGWTPPETTEAGLRALIAPSS